MTTIELNFVDNARTGLENLIVDGRGEEAVRLIKSFIERLGIGVKNPEYRRKVVLLLGDYVDANQSAKQGRGLNDDRRAALRVQALALAEELMSFAELQGLDHSVQRILDDQLTAIVKRSSVVPDNDLRLFMSYRRQDAADSAGRIRDQLTNRFGQNGVFMDVHDIPIGENFRSYIVGVLSRCTAILVVIGPTWTGMRDAQGKLRLHDPDDLVRIEIEVALKLGTVAVVPLFVGGASALSQDDLPPSLSDLRLREGQAIRADPDFRHDMDRLVERLESRLR